MTAPRAQVLADVRYAWCGPSMLVTTARGECGEEHRLTGFYFREATASLCTCGWRPGAPPPRVSPSRRSTDRRSPTRTTTRGANAGDSHAEIMEKRGTLRLLHQPPPESLDASPLDRLAALLKGVWHH